MPAPKLPEKRWSIDLEKTIQEAHYADEDAYSGRYAFNPDSGKEFFVIDTPPPYPSGTWHIGAVAQYSMIDVLARSQRLMGKEVYFPWGVDRNGINIEFTVEKNTKRKMKTYDREEFLKLCETTIESFTQAMRSTAKRVGLSCDFSREYLTDAPDYRSVHQSIFVDLFKKGDIVEDLRPNIYDPVEGTTIADAEVERLPRKTKLVDVRWTCEDGTDLVISTTRPELICACGVVVVHPDDERYQHLVGQQIHLPLDTHGRSTSVEIRQHPSVKSDFGTGVLMVCSFGDQNDVAVFRELGLTPFQAIDLNGAMTDVAGPLQGMSVLDARARAIDLLDQSGRLVQAVERDQDIPVSERGKNPVEIILLKEWYVRQTHIQDRMREHIESIDFHPVRNRQFLWIGWTTSALIGPSAGADGTTQKFQFGTAKIRPRSWSRPLEPTCNPGKTARPGSRVSTVKAGRTSVRLTTSKTRSVRLSEKKRCLTRGWIPQTPTSSSAVSLTTLRCSRRPSLRHFVRKARKSCEHGCTTPCSNQRWSSTNPDFNTCGSTASAWTRGAER